MNKCNIQHIDNVHEKAKLYTDEMNSIIERLIDKEHISITDLEIINRIKYVDSIFNVLKPELLDKLNKKLADSSFED